MAVTQREYDLMQLQAQIRVNQLVAEWKRQFLRGRLQETLSRAPTQSSSSVEGQPYAK